MKNFLSVLSSSLQGGLRGGLLTLALLATTSLWAYDFQSGDLYYNITSDSTVAVTYQEYNSSSNYASIYTVTVPETITYDGTTYSVTSIGDYAFYGCSSLTSITIHKSVTSIGNYAFADCSSLTSVTIPNSVISIRGSAFYNCSKLTKTNYTGDIAGWCNIKFGSGKANPMYYSHNFYINDQEIKDLVIPNSVTSIGSYAFYGCSSLTSVTIGNSVTSIGSWAFEDCSSLTSVTINSDAIVKKAYSSSSNISHIFGSQVTEYIIGNDVKKIGDNAFYKCSSLTSITIPNSVTSIGSEAFYGCSKLTKTNYTGDIAGWCNIMFGSNYANPMYCSHHFYINDQEIKDLVIPNSVDSIHDYAFYYCYSLTSVTLGESVTSIGEEAFAGCYFLTSVTIPNSVTSIGSSAFKNCSSLTSITCEVATPPTVGSETFYGVSTSIPVYVPCGSVQTYKAASGWSDFTNLQEPLAEYSIEVDVNDSIMGTAQVDVNNVCGAQISSKPNFGYHFVQWSDGNTNNPRSLELTQDTILTAEFALTQSGQCGDNLYWELIDDTLQITGTGAMYDYTYGAPWKRSIKALCIGESVTSIGERAFEDCSSLTSVTIGESVTSIGEEAFYGCSSLTSITIPNSVTSIGDDAFYKCSSLTYITIPESVTSIGDYAFFGCSSLTKTNYTGDIAGWCNIGFDNSSANPMYYSHNFYINDQEIKDLVIPNDVTSIGSCAFYGCSSLTSVTIPNNVTSIGSYAFYGCSALTSVTINSDAIVSKDYSYGDNISPIFGSQVTEYIIGDDVKGIGRSAFYDCYKLTSVKIGESVEHIGNYAFQNCSSLTSVTCEAETPPTIGKYAFDGVSTSIPVYVCGYVEAYKAASGWKNFTNIQEPLAEYSIEVNVNDTIMGTAKVDYNTFCEGNQISATPNFGYHFVQWSDGNTDLIRTLELTQDTILTAEFAQTVSGQCGDNLYWNYDETTKTISITGSGKMYDYTADTQPWLLFKEQLVEVTTTNTVTSIGTSAFEGCIRLSKISLGTGLEEIAANAFAGCTRLYDIYVYATYPPFAEESSFANYNVYVYIPCEYQRDYILDVVWGEFKFIECIDSEEATTDGNVTIVPGFNDVTITWPTETGADSYTIVIKKGDTVFCTLTFNADGQLLNIAFAPGRDGNHPAQYAEQAGNGYRFTVTGLEEGTHYTYNIDVKNAANNTIKSHSGEFTTMGDTTTAVEDVLQNSTNCQKLLRDNQLLILRDGKTYTIMGAEVK